MNRQQSIWALLTLHQAVVIKLQWNQIWWWWWGGGGGGRMIQRGNRCKRISNGKALRFSLFLLWVSLSSARQQQDDLLCFSPPFIFSFVIYLLEDIMTVRWTIIKFKRPICDMIWLKFQAICFLGVNFL